MQKGAPEPDECMMCSESVLGGASKPSVICCTVCVGVMYHTKCAGEWTMECPQCRGDVRRMTAAEVNALRARSSASPPRTLGATRAPAAAAPMHKPSKKRAASPPPLAQGGRGYRQNSAGSPLPASPGPSSPLAAASPGLPPTGLVEVMVRALPEHQISPQIEDQRLDAPLRESIEEAASLDDEGAWVEEQGGTPSARAKVLDVRRRMRTRRSGTFGRFPPMTVLPDYRCRRAAPPAPSSLRPRAKLC